MTHFHSKSNWLVGHIRNKTITGCTVFEFVILVYIRNIFE